MPRSSVLTNYNNDKNIPADLYDTDLYRPRFPPVAHRALPQQMFDTKKGENSKEECGRMRRDGRWSGSIRGRGKRRGRGPFRHARENHTMSLARAPLGDQRRYDMQTSPWTHDCP